MTIRDEIYGLALKKLEKGHSKVEVVRGLCYALEDFIRENLPDWREKDKWIRQLISLSGDLNLLEGKFVIRKEVNHD